MQASDNPDRTVFVLSPEEWDEFKELLERPAKRSPRLEELFSKEPVFLKESRRKVDD